MNIGLFSEDSIDILAKSINSIEKKENKSENKNVVDESNFDTNTTNGATTVYNSVTQTTLISKEKSLSSSAWSEMNLSSTRLSSTKSVSQESMVKLYGNSIKQNTKGTNFVDNNSSVLDSFFPFDPCLLQQLHSKVEKSYRM